MGIRANIYLDYIYFDNYNGLPEKWLKGEYGESSIHKWHLIY